MIGFGQTRKTGITRKSLIRSTNEAHASDDELELNDVTATLSSIQLKSEVVEKEPTSTTTTKRPDGAPLRDLDGTHPGGEQIQQDDRQSPQDPRVQHTTGSYSEPMQDVHATNVVMTAGEKRSGGEQPPAKRRPTEGATSLPSRSDTKLSNII